MTHRTLLTAIISFFVLTLNANIHYVQEGGKGNGTTWADASGDLAAILFVAEAGDEVWVAKGTYYPSYTEDRTRTFSIPNGVKVLAGFTGTETSNDQRDAKLNKTILSGNIGSTNDHSDNSYTVVSFFNTSEMTLMDGFIIADGTANSNGVTGEPVRCGGGIYVDGTGGKGANPVISNCTIQNNYGRDGGAVYNNGKRGQCNPTFINCNFFSNKADLDGGAVFNDGRHNGKSNPTFNNCEFSGNVGNYGGAICNYGGKGESSPILTNCTFQSNEAYLNGGGIFNMDVEGKTDPAVTHCQFIDNIATLGESIYTFSESQNQAAMLDGYKAN